MEKEGGRIAHDLHIARGAAEPFSATGLPGNDQSDKGNDAGGVRLAEPAVLHDGKAGEAREHSGPDVNLTQAVAPGDFFVANESDDSCSHSDEADGGVNDSECCKHRMCK